jgi:probable O-glycosylation ligase (exosortase A-associated)
MGAMLGLLWLKSRRKLMTGLLILAMVPLGFQLMPEQWFERMSTISTAADQDASAMGRINAWHLAINVANDNIAGGGFVVFTPRMFRVYAPNPLDPHAAHSIYFQVLGEHGYIGLAIYLTLLFCAWRTASRIQKECGDNPELKWAKDLAAMAQVSLMGYFTGGAFLSLAYYDFVYYLMALLVVMERHILSRAQAPQETAVLPQQASAGGPA